VIRTQVNQVEVLKVRQSRTGPLLRRHPWVFTGALLGQAGNLEAGQPIRLEDESGRYLGSGYYNPVSQIAVRVWSHDPLEAVNDTFFHNRVEAALALRQCLEKQGTDAYRLVNGEGDQLPGLVVDRYGRYLVVQFHTRGMEVYKQQIVAALSSICSPLGIYERSDTSVRCVEGLTSQTGVLHGTVPDLIEIRENHLRFVVDVKNGQKTGFFLDQRDKRLGLQKYVSGARVLNCFSYSGGFSVYALAAGAEHVVNVDVSEEALELVRENIQLNGFDSQRCSCIKADVKQYLAQPAGEHFDAVILDPPAFVKDRRHKKQGLAGYSRINRQAFAWLHAGGTLLTCSCSHHVSRDEFVDMLIEAAGREEQTLQLLEYHGHGLDHPRLIAHKEGAYLKAIFARVQEPG